MTATTPYPGTQSVVRAISVLKAFTDEHPEWSLTPLAQELGLNKATTFRLLTALESEALLMRDPHSDKYRLGPAVVTLGGRALRANNLRAVSHAELQALAAETNETASLEILQGAEALVLDEVVGGHVMSGTQSIGSRWPAHATSTGKALLALLPEDRLRRTLPPTLPAITPRTITDWNVLLSDLAVTRRRGYAVARGELEIGLLAIGAPVLNLDGQAIAAISIAGPTSRLTVKHESSIGQHVCACARRISRGLGAWVGHDG
jgi:DNA-binding IclR family transcriptional regulator